MIRDFHRLEHFTSVLRDSIRVLIHIKEQMVKVRTATECPYRVSVFGLNYMKIYYIPRRY
jgi:hypothetical protein